MNEKRNEKRTVLINIRLPADIIARLPPPNGQRGRAGTGRSAAIVKLLRQALNDAIDERSKPKVESSQ